MKPSGASFLLRLLLVVAVLAAWEGLVVLFEQAGNAGQEANLKIGLGLLARSSPES